MIELNTEIEYLRMLGPLIEASPVTRDEAKYSDHEGRRRATSVKVLVVVEDDPDVQFLIETIFSMDPRFTVSDVAESAEEALDVVRTTEPGVIVLDHGLAGVLTGLDAAPLLKELAPQAKIILFTAHAELQARASQEHAIDGFLLKTEPAQLLPLAQRLTGLGQPAS